MKKSIILIFSLLISLSIRAQFSVSYNFGYGSFCMKDARDRFKEYRSEASDYFGLDFKIVDNFPKNYINTFEIAYRKDLLEFGLQSSVFSTGGKISYADYSGYCNQTMLMKAFRQGFFLRYYPVKFLEKGASKIEVFAEVSPGVIFTQSKNKFELNALDEDILTGHLRGNCTSVTIIPSAGIQYAFNSSVKLNLKGGYEIEAYTGYLDFSDEYQKEYIETNWGGWRVSAGISYYF